MKQKSGTQIVSHSIVVYYIQGGSVYCAGICTHNNYQYSYTALIVESNSYRVVFVEPGDFTIYNFSPTNVSLRERTTLTIIDCPSKTLTVPLRIYYFRANKTNLCFFIYHPIINVCRLSRLKFLSPFTFPSTQTRI